MVGICVEDSSSNSIPEQWLVDSSSSTDGFSLSPRLYILEIGDAGLAKTDNGFQSGMVDSSLLYDLADVLSRTFSQQAVKCRSAQSEAQEHLDYITGIAGSWRLGDTSIYSSFSPRGCLCRLICRSSSCWSLGCRSCSSLVSFEEDCSLGLSVEWDVCAVRHYSHVALLLLDN